MQSIKKRRVTNSTIVPNTSGTPSEGGLVNPINSTFSSNSASNMISPNDNVLYFKSPSTRQQSHYSSPVNNHRGTRAAPNKPYYSSQPITGGPRGSGMPTINNNMSMPIFQRHSIAPSVQEESFNIGGSLKIGRAYSVGGSLREGPASGVGSAPPNVGLGGSVTPRAIEHRGP